MGPSKNSLKREDFSMAEQDPKESKHTVEIEFNQQQDVILRRLREEGRYGKTDGAIIRTAFREFLRQTRI